MLVLTLPLISALYLLCIKVIYCITSLVRNIRAMKLSQVAILTPGEHFKGFFFGTLMRCCINSCL